MNKQQQLSEAFKAYLQAHKELSRLWEEADLDGGEFSRLYPFLEGSFDELIPAVELWVNDAVQTLSKPPAKKFLWKDKTGRGFKNTFSLSDVLQQENVENWDGVELHEWAQEATEGEEFENSTAKYTCTEG